MSSIIYFILLLVFPSSASLLVNRNKGNDESIMEERTRNVFDADDQNSSYDERLYRSLFANYNKHVRPLNDSNKAIKVYINPSISGIIKADELDQSLKFFQWFPMIWRDEHLEWNPTQFGGLQYILVPAHLLWIPDIFAFTTMEAKEVMPLEKTNARVDYTGAVTLVKHQFLTVRCQYYILLFPFDVQQCRMPFGSWAYTSDQIEVDAFESKLAQQIFEENSEWEIISFTGKKETVTYESFSPSPPTIQNRTFQEIHYDLVFKRKPTFYIYMIVVPCSIIVNVCLLGLFAPFNTSGDREEKLTLGLTTMLTVSVILHIVTGEMPKSAEGLPLLGKFIMWELVICATAVAVSVLLMYGHRQMIKSRRVPPRWMRLNTANQKQKKSVEENHRTEEHLLMEMSGKQLGHRQMVKSRRFPPRWMRLNDTKQKKSTDENHRMEEHLLTEMSEKQQNHSEISSNDVHENAIHMTKLNTCAGEVKALKKQLLQIQDDISLHELWNVAFERIDLILLALFLTTNFVLTYIIFVLIPGS